MKTIRWMLVLALLFAGLGLGTACSSRGGCGSACGSACKGCAPDRNCCDGCRQGTGCTCP